jgi:hypothetical protein
VTIRADAALFYVLALFLICLFLAIHGLGVEVNASDFMFEPPQVRNFACQVGRQRLGQKGGRWMNSGAFLVLVALISTVFGCRRRRSSKRIPQ